MNKVFLIGNLTRDPELSVVSGDISVCRFGIAVNERFGKEGDKVNFFNIVVWRGLAENCAKYLVKGNKVAVSGRIEVRQYDDKDGVKKTAVDIIADDVEFLTPRGQAGEGYEPQSNQKSYGSKSSGRVSEMTPVADDNLPF